MSHPARLLPLRAVAAAPVPVHGNAFIGRARDLAALRALFDDGERLVTLLGPPGIGKTRLACEYAAGGADGRWAPDAVYFCDLTEAVDLEGVVRTLGHAFGVAVSERRSAADALAGLGAMLAALGDALVVLDNVEQVVAPVATATTAWLDRARSLRVLATSRELLRARSERAYEMLPLETAGHDAAAAGAAPSDAVCLLLDRVRRVHHGFVAAPRDAALYDQIARQLDGLPLALELAAARVAVLGPVDVLHRLTSRFDLLSHGARDAASRLRTLRGAIDSSWDLLGDDERAALAQCAVFRGGFALDAAEHVLGNHGPAPFARATFEIVQALREKSLLRAEPFAPTTAPVAPARFGTYLSVRDYAAERLAESPALRAAAEARHGAYYASVAEGWAREVHGPRGLDAIARLRAERENLAVAAERALAQQPPTRAAAEVALRVALGLDPLVMALGPVEPHLALLDRALAAGDAAGADALLSARVVSARGRLRRRRGRLAEGRADQELAAAVGRARGDAGLEGLALSRLSSALHSQGHVAAAFDASARALVLHRAAGDELEEAITLSNVGAFVEEQGRLAEALAYCERALAIHHRLGNRRYAAITLATMAVCYGDDGRDARARDCGERALAAGRALGDCMVITSAAYTLALLDAVAGRAAHAVAGLECGLAAARQNGNRRFEGIHLGLLGAVAAGPHARQRLDDAVACLDDAGDARYGAFVAALRAAREPDDGDPVATVAASLDAAERGFDAHPGDPLGAAVRALRVPLHLRRARDATARGDAAATRHERALARGACARFGDAAATPRTLDVRFAFALARRALADDAALAPPAALLVHPRGDWFQATGEARVACKKRQAIRLLLVRLVEHRLRTPGAALSPEQLLAAGWPGERIQPDAARLRLRVSLTRLRQMGLRDALHTRDDGYLLDPQLPVRFADAT